MRNLVNYLSCWWTRCPIKNLEQTFPLTRVPLPHFHISSHFDGLALPFRAARFSEQLLSLKTNLFEIKITTEELLFRSRYFYSLSNFSGVLLFRQCYFFKRGTFSKQLFQRSSTTKHLSRTTFSGWLLSQKSYFLGTFSQFYLLSTATFLIYKSVI